MKKILLVTLLLMPVLAPTYAQAQVSGIAGYLLVGKSTVAAMPAASTVNRGLWYVTDDADCDPATADDGFIVCIDIGASWLLLGPDAGSGGAPDAHASTHQDGGSDEISVAGLIGLLATAQTPAAHTQAATTISDSTVAGRALLTATDATAQRTALALGTAATEDVPATGDAAVGEVVKGDDTRLTDARTPTTHASTHQHSGADEVATATPAANAIPKAGAGGTIASGWVPTLNQSTTGNAATATALAANPAACDVGDFVTDVAADGTLTCDTPAAGGGSSSGTTLQVGDGAGGFAALTSSSVSGANVTLGGNLTLPDAAVIAGPNNTGTFTLHIRPNSGTGSQTLAIGNVSGDGLNVNVESNNGASLNLKSIASTYQILGFFHAGTRKGYAALFADGTLRFSRDSSSDDIVIGASGGVAINEALTVTGGLQLVPASAPPVTCGSGGTAGVKYFDIDSAEECLCDGTSWTGLKAGGACS